MRLFEFDTLTEILLTMKQNKLRSFLTGFAVSWGIFMLIMLLGFGRAEPPQLARGLAVVRNALQRRAA